MSYREMSRSCNHNNMNIRLLYCRQRKQPRNMLLASYFCATNSELISLYGASMTHGTEGSNARCVIVTRDKCVIQI
jgi:hypothetical protein